MDFLGKFYVIEAVSPQKPTCNCVYCREAENAVTRGKDVFSVDFASAVVGMPLADALAFLRDHNYPSSDSGVGRSFRRVSIIRRDGVFLGCDCNPMAQSCLHLEVNGDHVVAAFQKCQNGHINAWEEGRNIKGPNEEKD